MTATVHPKIDPAFKAKWVEALRSGKFRQGKNRLATFKNKRYSYCCLGVRCVIDPTIKRDREWSFLDNEVAGRFDGEMTYLSSAQRDAIGLSYQAEKCLAEMNDSGKSFNEIADWIEENL